MFYITNVIISSKPKPNTNTNPNYELRVSRILEHGLIYLNTKLRTYNLIRYTLCIIKNFLNNLDTELNSTITTMTCLLFLLNMLFIVIS